MSDINLFIAYLEARTNQRYAVTFNDTAVSNQTSLLMGKIATRTCSFIKTTAEGHEFSCLEINPWFAIFTLVFVYQPSVNVIATLYGPGAAGYVATFYGFIMCSIGGIYLPFSSLFWRGLTIPGWLVFCLGAAVLGLGLVDIFCGPVAYYKPDAYHNILFIPLLACSPGIFIIIKLIAVMKANNRFIQSQATYGSRGEAILEAAPQLGLQLYIILLSMSATEKQWLSIITSAAIISLPNIENYISARGGYFGFKSIIKNILVFLPACLFKILSLSILAVFLRGWVIVVIAAIIILVCVTLGCTRGCYDLPDVSDDSQQFWGECVFLSWLTLGGLGRTKYAAVCRFVSTLTVTILYSLMLGIIMVICNVYQDSVPYFDFGNGVSWSELELVKEPIYLNLILGFTIGLGWISFLLDVILAWCKSHDWKSHNWRHLSKFLDWFVDEDMGEETVFWYNAKNYF